MKNKIKQIGKYALFVIWTNAIYGLMLYYVFIWLSGYSLIYAYFGNLLLIVFGLATDEYMQKKLQSDKFIMQLKQDNNEKDYRTVRLIVDNFVSFKTSLYLFYIFILIASQIINIDPSLMSDNIRNFISTNDYSILFLIALDMLIKQFSNDRKKMKETSKKMEELLDENKE